MDKVSVIVPVYNVEQFLCRCIDSILRQSYQNFELILVDDGSPDRCGEICDNYAVKDSRVHVIHQENAGVSAARNAGMDWVMENCDSQWVAFIDSDDWIHRDYLKILLTAAQQHNTKMAACNMLWTDSFCADMELQGAEIKLIEAEQVFSEHYELTLSVCCKLIHCSVLSGIRFPEGRRYEDAAVCHLMVFATESIAVCPECLYYYFSNENSFTRIAWTESRMEVVDVHRSRLEYLREHGFEKAYRRELEEYAERITSTLFNMTDLVDENEKLMNMFQELRAELRSVVQEAEKLDAFHLDRERLMTYAYICPGGILWRSARWLQRIWHKAHGREK